MPRVPMPPDPNDALAMAKAAAMLDKPVANQAPLRDGQLPVHANDLRVDATNAEVVLTWLLTTGGGSSGSRPETREVGRTVISWPFFDGVLQTLVSVAQQAMPTRVEAARAMLVQVEQMQAGMAEQDGAEGPPAD